MPLTLHPLIKEEIKSVLDFYASEAGPHFSTRFFDEFETLVRQIEKTPGRFHPVTGGMRRANFRSFPYHLLFRETDKAVRILVLRHHRRNPNYGADRE